MNLDIGGKVITGNFNIANSINSFFNTIANKLVDKLPSATGTFDKRHVEGYYKKRGIQEDSFSFSRMSENTVFKKLTRPQPCQGDRTGQDYC